MAEDSSNEVRAGGRFVAILGMFVACGAYVLVACTTTRPTERGERPDAPSCHCVDEGPSDPLIFDLGKGSSLKQCALQGSQVTFETSTDSTYTVTFDGGSPFEGVDQIVVTKNTPSRNMLKPVPPEGRCYYFQVTESGAGSGGGFGEPMNGTLEVATSGHGEPPNKP